MGITESLVSDAEQATPKRSLSDRLLSWTAIGFGAGRLPVAPGTWGSVQAVLLVALIYRFGGVSAFSIHLAVTILLFAVAVPAAARVVREAGDPDPPSVVIDEIVGQAFCLLWIPPGWQWMLVGLLLFRLFDIWKPFPIRRLERIPGGFGIILDDLAAAIYASVLLWGVNQI